MTASVNGLTINDMEKAIAININNTPNNRKRHVPIAYRQLRQAAQAGTDRRTDRGIV